MRVRIRYTPTAGLTRMLFSTATIDLDLIDYPGEWLLDLPMLTQSYQEWSARMEELANAGSRSGLSRAWLEAARGLDPEATEDPAALQRIGDLYLDYIRRCQSERHLHFVQPGRFLGGDGVDPERGADLLPARQPGAERQRPAPTPRRSSRATRPIRGSFAASTARCSGGCAGRWCSSIC